MTNSYKLGYIQGYMTKKAEVSTDLLKKFNPLTSIYDYNKESIGLTKDLLMMLLSYKRLNEKPGK